MKVVLTVAGSDSSGGAGIQADLKTILAHGLYGESAITALTAQNTTGVRGVLDVPPEFVALQLNSIFEDIPPDAVKVGMVSNAATIRVLSSRLRAHRAKHVVVDPVMVATSGSRLLNEDALDVLRTDLLPLAELVTPNIPEAEILSGSPIRSRDDMLQAGRVLARRLPGAVLLKGGHLADCADDLLLCDGVETWFRQERIDNPNTHGTGCTLSSAIACGLACGKSVADSVAAAKAYLVRCLCAMLNLGRGSGPLNHAFSPPSVSE